MVGQDVNTPRLHVHPENYPLLVEELRKHGVTILHDDELYRDSGEVLAVVKIDPLIPKTTFENGVEEIVLGWWHFLSPMPDYGHIRLSVDVSPIEDATQCIPR